MPIQVRPFQEADLLSIVDYFYNASPEYLKGMGADHSKLPPKEEWLSVLQQQLILPFPKKENFYLIWELDGQAIGHNNINQIQFGVQAFMHLHLWQNPNRQKGLGTAFLQQSIPQFFELFELKRLYCEPFAENPAPNRTLPKLSFQLEKSYETIPGTINFHQRVNRWLLEKSQLR